MRGDNEQEIHGLCITNVKNGQRENAKALKAHDGN